MIIKLIRMNIDYTVTALMFPAIPLLMSVYSNRFHSLSILIRELHDEHVYEKHIPPEWKKHAHDTNAAHIKIEPTVRKNHAAIPPNTPTLTASATKELI